MEHFDYNDPGDTPGPSLFSPDLGDSDIGGFAAGLDGAIDNITAEDNALTSEYGHTADPGGTASGAPGSGEPAAGELDSSDQVFLGLLGQAEAGTLPADAGTDPWADGLGGTVDGTQAQTDAVIAQAEHSHGSGEGYSPQAAAALNGFNIADGIQASDYQDFEDVQAASDTDDAIADAGAAADD